MVVESSNLLRGNLVWLDRRRLDDLPIYLKWWQDMDDAQKLTFDALKPVSPDELEARFQRSSDQYLTFSIRTIADNTLIGDLSLVFVDYRNRSLMMGIYIGEKRYRNGGYGTDTIKVALRYAFLELNMNRFELGVFDFNPARRLYERLGFVYEGSHRQQLYRDGQYHDIHNYSILRDEWLDQMSMS